MPLLRLTSGQGVGAEDDPAPLSDPGGARRGRRRPELPRVRGAGSAELPEPGNGPLPRGGTPGGGAGGRARRGGRAGVSRACLGFRGSGKRRVVAARELDGDPGSRGEEEGGGGADDPAADSRHALAARLKLR